MDDETLKCQSEDVELPFEERCQHAYEYHRRTRPGGRPFDDWLGSWWHVA